MGLQLHCFQREQNCHVIVVLTLTLTLGVRGPLTMSHLQSLNVSDILELIHTELGPPLSTIAVFF